MSQPGPLQRQSLCTSEGQTWNGEPGANKRRWPSALPGPAHTEVDVRGQSADSGTHRGSPMPRAQRAQGGREEETKPPYKVPGTDLLTEGIAKYS